MVLKEFLECIRLCDKIELTCGSVHYIKSVSDLMEDPAYMEFLKLTVALIRSYHAIGISDYYFIVLEDCNE